MKHGLRIVSSQTTNPAWSLSFDVNGKHIAAAVTAVRNFSVPAHPSKYPTISLRHFSRDDTNRAGN